MNMQQWCADVIAGEKKKAIPVLSFPCVQLMGVTVRELVNSSELQAEGMRLVAERVNSGASVSMMDLSVEAEAFGSAIRTDEHEIPTVTDAIVQSLEAADALAVPAVGAGRTAKYVQAIGRAVELIPDRPVFAGIIGPFSLAGRLMGVSDALMNCYDEPEMVHATMQKATEFLIAYARAYRDVHAAGVVMAEPLTGLLSPDMAEEFSEPYVRQIVEAVQEDDFLVIYHNCGASAVKMIPSLLRTGARAFHFGNKVDMETVLKQMPGNVIAMGNIDPANEFRNGTPESVRAETMRLLNACGGYKNFVISSGCDIPPESPWENIDAFFSAVDAFYAAK